VAESAELMMKRVDGVFGRGEGLGKRKLRAANQDFCRADLFTNDGRERLPLVEFYDEHVR
jgi:hypothetical protein